MAVSPSYKEYIVERLSEVTEVRYKNMFGGGGIYADALFFAVVSDDTLYFKVDDGNREDYIAEGMEPFFPFGDRSKPMGYYEVPSDVLEDTSRLKQWMGKAVAAAAAAAASKGKKKK